RALIGGPPALISFPTRRSSDLGHHSPAQDGLSRHDVHCQHSSGRPRACGGRPLGRGAGLYPQGATRRGGTPAITSTESWHSSLRSEEHTSELQSRENLVCLLLL